MRGQVGPRHLLVVFLVGCRNQGLRTCPPGVVEARHDGCLLAAVEVVLVLGFLEQRLGTR